MTSNIQRGKKTVMGLQEENGGKVPQVQIDNGSKISQSTLNQHKECKIPVWDPMHPSSQILLARLTPNKVIYM